MNKIGKKITIIGLGRSGIDTVLFLIIKKILNYEDSLVLVDIKNKAKGVLDEVFSLIEFFSAPCPSIFTVNAENENELLNLKNTDIFILCYSAPFSKKNFYTRDASIKKNIEITKFYARIIKKYSPNSFVIIDTNPLDIICSVFFKESKIIKEKIIGKGADLDTQRLRGFLAHYLAKKKYSKKSYFQTQERQKIFNFLEKSGDSVCIVGPHSTEDMVVVLDDNIIINEKKISEWFSKEELENIKQKAKKAGLLASCLMGDHNPSKGGALINVSLVEKLLSKRNNYAYGSILIDGFYGVNKTGVFVSTKCVIGNLKIKKNIEINQILKSERILKEYKNGIVNVQNKIKSFF